jgi:gliding motility-associated-like protein
MITASDCQSITYIVQNSNYYVHIQAVDCAGNLSQVTTIKASDAQSIITFYDTTCPNKSYAEHGFNIPANDLQTAGNYEFRDTLPSATSCDTIIILKLNVLKDSLFIFATICEGEIYQENGFNETTTGTYYDTLQNRFGCDSVVILHLLVVKPDTDSIFASICQGETYNKNGFNASKTDTYYQNLKNMYGCDSLVVLNLTVNPVPNIEIVEIANNFCVEDFAIIEVQTNGDSFLWNTGSSENQLKITKAGLYSATAFLRNRKKTASYILEECPCLVYIPNAFSPNGDGLNEVFRPVISCYETLKDYKLYVYNRWGEIVFKSSDYAIGWDGTNHIGKYCSSGVYYCVIEFITSKNERIFKNTSVTLLR